MIFHRHKWRYYPDKTKCVFRWCLCGCAETPTWNGKWKMRWEAMHNVKAIKYD